MSLVDESCLTAYLAFVRIKIITGGDDHIHHQLDRIHS